MESHLYGKVNIFLDRMSTHFSWKAVKICLVLNFLHVKGRQYLPYDYYAIDGDGCHMPPRELSSQSTTMKLGTHPVKTLLMRLTCLEWLKPTWHWHSNAFNTNVGCRY